MFTMKSNAIAAVLDEVGKITDHVRVDTQATSVSWDHIGEMWFRVTVPPCAAPHTRPLPGARNSRLVLTGIGDSGKSAIVVYHDGQFHWYLLETSGIATMDRWLTGWRPDRSTASINLHAKQVLKHLYA